MAEHTYGLTRITCELVTVEPEPEPEPELELELELVRPAIAISCWESLIACWEF